MCGKKRNDEEYNLQKPQQGRVAPTERRRLREKVVESEQGEGDGGEHAFDVPVLEKALVSLCFLASEVDHPGEAF